LPEARAGDADNFDALKRCDPQLPGTAFNRLADNWRPLFAIAEIAGGDWPKRCADAYAKLTATDDLDAHGIGTLLLADIAEIYRDEHTDKIPSARICELLVALEGRPWAEWGRHRKPISPQVIRIGDETPRGYMLDDFSEAFTRYLTETPFSKCNSATTLGKIPVFEVQQPESVLHPEEAAYTRECCGVAPSTGEDPDLEAINRELALTEEADLRRAQPVVLPTDDDSDLVL
jgi:hypothetical protein